jgi:hypothetical protein
VRRISDARPASTPCRRAVMRRDVDDELGIVVSWAQGGWPGPSPTGARSVTCGAVVTERRDKHGADRAPSGEAGPHASGPGGTCRVVKVHSRDQGATAHLPRRACLPHARGARARAERRTLTVSGTCEHAFGGGAHAVRRAGGGIQARRLVASVHRCGHRGLCPRPASAKSEALRSEEDSAGCSSAVAGGVGGTA